MAAYVLERYERVTSMLFKTLFGLLFRMGLVVLIGLGAGGGMVIALLGRGFEPWAVKVCTALAVGLSAGLSARVFLNRNTRLLKALSTWVTLAFSLVLLHILSGGVSGFSVFFQNEYGVNWEGLWQIALGIVIAWLPIQAWGSRRKKKSPEALPDYDKLSNSPDPASATSIVVPVERPTPHLSQARHLQDRITRMVASLQSSPSRATVASAPAPVTTSTPAKVRTGKSTSRKTKIAAKPASPAGKTSRPRSGTAKSRRSRVHLEGKIEHRCPYCLDPVDPHDPRGVKVCPICHTYHHKDCWDVTGTCQIPHENAL